MILMPSLIAMLATGAIAAPAQKVLLVAEPGNFVTRGLEALGVEHERVSKGGFTGVSPFGYDLIIWGLDEDRSVLNADPSLMDAFVDSGGVFLGFRANQGDPWLPVPMRRDKAYELGDILEPEHPIFQSPNRIGKEELANVHSGSIYDAFYDLGPGWKPLVSTGREQAWDKREAQDKGPHYGIAELRHGKGLFVLTQMIPEYHWFNDTKGDNASEGARLFENLVVYALSQAGTAAATRQKGVVPPEFRREFTDLLAIPRGSDGLRLDDGWQFSANGPYSMKTDRRGVLTFTHQDKPSVAGSFAQVSRSVEVPDASGRIMLRWYESDTYCGGREIVLGGAAHGQTALQNFKKDARYAQVLVNGTPVWEEDVLGRNPQPAKTRVRLADITHAVKDAGGRCEVTLRVEDRQGSGEDPFAIDVFWAAVDVFGDLLKSPAAEALKTEGFTAQEDGSLLLDAARGRLTHEFRGPTGKYRIAARLRDGVDGRSTVSVNAGGPRETWQLTADDHRFYWVATDGVNLSPGQTVELQFERDQEEPVLVTEFALIPERLAARPDPEPTRPPLMGEHTPRVRFTLTVPESENVARSGEIASQGVPFPAGCLVDGAGVRITDEAGNVVPVQVRRIRNWPDGSAKVALLSFPVSVGAGGRANLTVEAGEGVAPSPSLGGLTVRETADQVLIETGRLSVTLSKTSGRIVDEVRRDGQVVKPADQVWELVLEDENGRTVGTAGETVTETQIVDAGPLRALVVRKGSFRDAEGSLVDFRLQLEAQTGSDALKLDAIIVNREETPEVYLKRWSMKLGGQSTGRVWLAADQSRAANPGDVLYQHTEKLVTWTGQDGAISRGELKSPGFVRLPGMAVGTRWFWQRFPQAIRFEDNGLRYDFIPQAFDEQDLPTRWADRMKEMTDRYAVGGVGYPQSPGRMGLFRLARGEALSNEIRFVFDGAPVDAPIATAFAPLTDRLRAVPDPAYTASTMAFGVFQPEDKTLFTRYENSTDGLYKGYLGKREGRREYGFENFGDDTFEWGYGPSYTYWSNSEYDHHHGFLLQYLRSQDPRWLEIGEQQARMYQDVVVVHDAPEGSRQQGGPRHHNATSVWMPSHPEQAWVADHTAAGTSAGHSWAEGIVDYWYLTGDPWTGEVVLEMADWYCDIVEANNFGAGGQERGPGWALIALSALNGAVDDDRLRRAGWTVANWIIDYQDPIRGVVSVPISEQPSYEGGSTFMHGIVGRGLGRWYDVTGDERVRQACINISEWITTEPMGPMARFWYKQSPQNSRNYGADGQCITALSYAWALSGDPWFATVTHSLYEQTGASSRSMSWYPQALAHLATWLRPLTVKASADTAIATPEQPAKCDLTITNTSAGPLNVFLSAECPEGFSAECPPGTELPQGETQVMSVVVSATSAPASGTVFITVRANATDGTGTTRRLAVPVRSVEKVVTLDLPVESGTVQAPVCLASDDGRTYAHAPRGADFVAAPRPQDGVSGGWIDLSVVIPAAGEYQLSAEVYWLDEEGNSLFVSVDGGPESLLGNTGNLREWTRVAGPKYALTAGVHTVRVRTREDGARLRSVRLTNHMGS